MLHVIVYHHFFNITASFREPRAARPRRVAKKKKGGGFYYYLLGGYSAAQHAHPPPHAQSRFLYSATAVPSIPPVLCGPPTGLTNLL